MGFKQADSVGSDNSHVSCFKFQIDLRRLGSRYQSLQQMRGVFQQLVGVNPEEGQEVMEFNILGLVEEEYCRRSEGVEGAVQVVLVVKNPPANAGDIREASQIPGSGRSILWRRTWQPTPIFLPREYHGQRSLVNYSSWSYKSQT